MPKVTFKSEGVSVEAQKGESILDVALAHGVPLDHNCGGFCACTTCHVIVEQGMDQLSEIGEDEEDRLDMADGLTLKSRLGCQATLVGDGEVVVNIPDSTRNIQGD
ncbi:MAG TPA: 2Fe-2S iron-sulfur cluster-binding protein [bacterium]|nr:2Fe-2S iron-sulfur cluster-binding protein [bacterium]